MSGYPVSPEGILLLDMHYDLAQVDENEIAVLVRRIAKIRQRREERYGAVMRLAFAGASGRPPEGAVELERVAPGEYYLRDGLSHPPPS